MERQVVVADNGRELQQTDVNDLGEAGGMADDRVLWELLRLTKGSATPIKRILPYGTSDWKDPNTGVIDSTATVVGEKADGSVRVMPFRAIVGSTQTTVTALDHLRGQKSGYHYGTSAMHRTVAITANSSGNPRWTLVYAAVTPDLGATETRYLKDPSTGAVSSATYTVSKSTIVSIGTTDGTPGASPTPPTLPADGAGTYNIALAYIWVPNGFTSGSTVGRGQIWEVMPTVPINTATGAQNLSPANQSYTKDGTIHTRQGHNQALRPGAYLPSAMMGGESRIILLQRGLSPLSHNDGDVIDDSIDWRYRYFRWHILVKSGTTAATAFASDRNLTGATPTGASGAATHGINTYYGVGQSFIDDNATTIAYASSNGTAMYTHDGLVTQLGSSTGIAIHVRNTDGALVFKTSGAGTYQAIIWLDATGPYDNWGTK